MNAQPQFFPCSAVGDDGEKITIVIAGTPTAAIVGLARISRQDTGDILDELDDGVFKQVSTGKIFRRRSGEDPIQGGFL